MNKRKKLTNQKFNNNTLTLSIMYRERFPSSNRSSQNRAAQQSATLKGGGKRARMIDRTKPERERGTLLLFLFSPPVKRLALCTKNS